jgi:hypothetical protein
MTHNKIAICWSMYRSTSQNNTWRILINLELWRFMLKDAAVWVRWIGSKLRFGGRQVNFWLILPSHLCSVEGKQRQVAKCSFKGKAEDRTVYVYAVMNVTSHSIKPSNTDYCSWWRKSVINWCFKISDVSRFIFPF